MERFCGRLLCKKFDGNIEVCHGTMENILKQFPEFVIFVLKLKDVVSTWARELAESPESGSLRDYKFPKPLFFQRCSQVDTLKSRIDTLVSTHCLTSIKVKVEEGTFSSISDEFDDMCAKCGIHEIHRNKHHWLMLYVDDQALFGIDPTYTQFRNVRDISDWSFEESIRHARDSCIAVDAVEKMRREFEQRGYARSS